MHYKSIAAPLVGTSWLRSEGADSDLQSCTLIQEHHLSQRLWFGIEHLRNGRERLAAVNSGYKYSLVTWNLFQRLLSSDLLQCSAWLAVTKLLPLMWPDVHLADDACLEVLHWFQDGGNTLADYALKWRQRGKPYLFASVFTFLLIIQIWAGFCHGVWHNSWTSCLDDRNMLLVDSNCTGKSKFLLLSSMEFGRICLSVPAENCSQDFSPQTA